MVGSGNVQSNGDIACLWWRQWSDAMICEMKEAV